MKLSPNAAKAEALGVLLREYDVVGLWVVCGVPGVVLPADLLAREAVLLEIGLNQSIPITDLAIDEEGISGTLSFGRTPFYCVVPWGALAGVKVPGVKEEPAEVVKRPQHLKDASALEFDPSIQAAEERPSGPPVLRIVR